MSKTKALKPELLYGNYDAEPFVFTPAICPVCGKQVPLTLYCCECGQKFILPKKSKGGEAQ